MDLIGCLFIQKLPGSRFDGAELRDSAFSADVLLTPTEN